MSSLIEISDDDDSFGPENPPVSEVTISDDEEECKVEPSLDDTPSLTPNLSLENKKTSVIKELFSKIGNKKADKENIKSPGINKMIEGVNVNLPVNPYGCQIAIMSKVIKAIKMGQNCLLESPTGSGKTLALLCGSLAWLMKECETIEAEGPKWFPSEKDILKKENGCAENAVKRPKYDMDETFSKPIFGESNIYGKREEKGGGDTPDYGVKRETPLHDSFEDNSEGEVAIHKKQRVNSPGEASTSAYIDEPDTSLEMQDGESSPSKRNLYIEINNLHMRSIHYSSLPTIYYGARTHKQIQQVIVEFKRTSYCGKVPMTLLSSRDHSCIREFDKAMWKSKNDMCRGCTKVAEPKDKKTEMETNCKYFDNRKAINHEKMPPSFDIEDLITAGHELTACPYYAAREMAKRAHIVFCPYNYLIEPNIRRNMNISLSGNIVIIDEGHNIEDVCRDAATFKITHLAVQSALKDLENMTKYQYEHSAIMHIVESLLDSLRNWNDWFSNNESWVTSQENSREAPQYIWDVKSFAQSLTNHNIGYAQYNEFKKNASEFCRRQRDEPRSMLFVSQDTGALLETIDQALEYLFRSNCEYMDDFKPILEMETTYNKRVTSQTLSLRLICLNPALVFSPLTLSRCVIVASGTLAPLHSLKSELGAHFPLCISPNHVIRRDRVWVGSLRWTAGGRALRCTYSQLQHNDVVTSLGRAVLRACRAVPHGLLCFLSSYSAMDQLVKKWELTGIWQEINKLKHVFKEDRDGKKHNEIMQDYYECCASAKGALLLAVYRGKVSEGMDFRDHQARAVIAIGIPYPNIKDEAVKAKKQYNDKYQDNGTGEGRGLLSGDKWYKIQAYRALNQAVGRCVRHSEDWGAVLLLDQRFSEPDHISHLPKWLQNFLGDNHHTFESLFESANGLEKFMERMSLLETQKTRD